GAAQSLVYLENFNTSDTLTVNTGAGQDHVVFENAGSTGAVLTPLFGASSVSKLATFNLGDDDDEIEIGVSSAAGSDSFVKFLGGLSVIGGTGTDKSNHLTDATINFFKSGTTPTLDVETVI